MRKSATSESEVKRNMVKSVKEAGGYARRVEDQYGVGIYDLIIIPRGLPVFMTEVKIIRGSTFGPTERQHIELMRIKEVADASGHVIPLMIGFQDGVYYFHKPQLTINCNDCFSVTTSDVSFHYQLVQYYHSQKGTT